MDLILMWLFHYPVIRPFLSTEIWFYVYERILYENFFFKFSRKSFLTDIVPWSIVLDMVSFSQPIITLTIWNV